MILRQVKSKTEGRSEGNAYPRRFLPPYWTWAILRRRRSELEALARRLLGSDGEGTRARELEDRRAILADVVRRGAPWLQFSESIDQRLTINPVMAIQSHASNRPLPARLFLHRADRCANVSDCLRNAVSSSCNQFKMGDDLAKM